jgi:hypothetical protein
MTFRGLITIVALAGALMLATSTAQAGYSYTAVPSPAVMPFGVGSVATLSPVGSVPPGVPVLSGVNDVKVANVALSSTTVPPPTDTTSYTVTIPITITNAPSPGTPGTGTITLTGTLAFTRSDSMGETSTFTPTGFTGNGASIGGVTYTLSFFSYAPPTVNNPVPGDGAITVAITPNFIPEPASMVMLGCGLVGVLGFGLRRMKKA